MKQSRGDVVSNAGGIPLATLFGHAFVGIVGVVLGLIVGLATALHFGWIEFRC